MAADSFQTVSLTQNKSVEYPGVDNSVDARVSATESGPLKTTCIATLVSSFVI